MSIFQKIKKGRIKKPLFCILYSGPGVGKCFDPSTRVLMLSGETKQIKDIVPGDIVMGPDSKGRKVLGISHGSDQMYKVTLNKGDSFICNSRHDLIGENKRFKEFKIEAKDCFEMPKERQQELKMIRTGVEFKSNHVDIDPYFIGVWLGDGCKDLKVLRISTPDIEIQRYLRSYSKRMGCELKIDDGLNMRIVGYSRGNSTGKHPFKNKLKKCIINDEKRIPKEYLVNSESKRLKLLAGLLDTDGYLINKTFEIVSQYDGLASDIVFLSKSLGLQATRKIKVVNGKEYHRIFISGETSIIPTRIKRKQSEKRKQIKSVLREGFSIEKSHFGEYVGIHVDGDHLFLLDNFVIVHNTDFGASFPEPLFFDFEESTHNIDVERIDNLGDFQEVMNGLQEIYNEQPGSLPFKSIVFDTIDELERMMHNHIAQDNNKKSIDHIGWQKGFDYAVNLWADLISICRQIRDKHKIHFLFLAHDSQKSKDDIEKEESYVRNTINVHKKAIGFLFGAVEMVLYAKKVVKFRKDSEGRAHAVDTDERVLCSRLSAHYDAKNRIGLPGQMPMPVKNGFSVLWKAYETEFNRTPEEMVSLCKTALEKVTDKDKKDQIGKYIELNKTDIEILRSCLIRIKEITGDQQ